ncbi:UbiD family decarboxylase [Haloferax sp. DFSO52]|uniref:UbiD family decarboxylase n=1 Tax=Haloferax sp. DFSO52 TaxID=3388505 RepID=UPI003A87BF93
MSYDLRDFIADIDGVAELAHIEGADWDKEIGGITELVAEKGGGLGGPALLFDDIEGYPAGFRILSNSFGSIERTRIALNMSSDLGPIDIVDAWRKEFSSYEALEPEHVSGDAPVLENIDTGDEIDVTKFPVPQWHEHDGGRYIGTGCTIVTKDPDTGWVNLGVYRSMILDEETISLWVAPGKDARVTMEKYHERGENCPVAFIAGLDPHTWIASMSTARRQESEYDIAGWIRGEPIPVTDGPETGLPIPADAEIVIEGEIPPVDERSCVDGPFGEWPGYSTPAHDETPLIEVKSVLYRDDPILLGQPPLKPPAIYTVGIPIRTAGGVWNQLDDAGISGVTGVWSHVIERPQFLVVSVDQDYAGHAKQVGIAAATMPNGIYGGRYVVVVDDDIDITSLEDVIWAMSTRCKADDIEILDGLYTSPLDPILEDRSDNRSSRAIIDATMPYKGEFPRVNRFSDEYREELVEKWNLDEFGI